MSRDVFVSYSLPDRDCAFELVARLEGRGLSVWIAPRDISPAAEWAEEIIDAISSARLMLLEAPEGIGMQGVLQHPCQISAGPVLQLRARNAAEGCVDERRLDCPGVRAPQQKAHTAGQRPQQARQAPGVAQQIAHDVRQQRIAARQRAIEVEDRDQRLARSGSAPRRRGGGLAQAALPAAASCRSTYCRMPPWR